MLQLSEQEQSILQTTKMGRRIGLGTRPALIIIDVQVYMMGDIREPIEVSMKTYPSSCGEMAWDAVENIKQLIDAFRRLNAPVIYTYMGLRADGSDAGPFKLKRDLLTGDNWMIEGTHGAQISPAIPPTPQDYVFMKKRPSAFFGTPLEAYLHGHGIDTTVMVGGSTSSCVRATVFDSASYGYRTIVAADGVMDRMLTSHEVNLRDMDRQFADVMRTQEILDALSALKPL